MTEKEITVKGIIAGSFPYGEYGKRLILLTDALGKVTAFAKGAAKQTSKIIGLSRLFTCGEFVLSEGAGAYGVHGIRVIDSFEEISTLPESAFLGQYVLETASYYTKEGIAETDAKSMLNLVYVTLSALREEALPAELLRRIYELRLLRQEGIYEEAPAMKTAIAGAAWNYVLNCPLSHLFDKEKWDLCEETGSFTESVRILWEKEAGHRFKTAEFL